MADSIGSQAQKPLAIVVVGGMLVTLALTRYLMPVLYSFFPAPMGHASCGEDRCLNPDHLFLTGADKDAVLEGLLDHACSAAARYGAAVALKSAHTYLAAPTGALAQDLALEAAQADEELEQMIDINRVEGRVRASSLRKVGDIVDKHPEEAVSILRNWLYQES